MLAVIIIVLYSNCKTPKEVALKKNAILSVAANTAVLIPGWEWWAWPLAKNFIGGRNLREARKNALRLSQKGYPIIFNYASEHVKGFWQASETRIAYVELLDWLKDKKISASLSLKFSQFGLTPKDILRGLKPAETELFLDVLSRARGKNIKVWIDAEHLIDRRHYSYVLPMLWKKGFENLGRVIQTNAKCDDWENFVKNCALVPMPIRICKGAYRNGPDSFSFATEYPRILLQYNYALNYFLNGGIETEVATHDPEIIGDGYAPYNAHFAMLMGVNVQKAKELKNIGEAPHLYFIFGPNWSGYLKRRILENPGYLLLPFKSAPSGIEAY